MTRLEIVVGLICGPYAVEYMIVDKYTKNEDREILINKLFNLADELVMEGEKREEQRKGYPIQSKFVPVEPNKKDDIPF
jgi:hypothetical protein